LLLYTSFPPIVFIKLFYFLLITPYIVKDILDKSNNSKQKNYFTQSLSKNPDEASRTFRSRQNQRLDREMTQLATRQNILEEEEKQKSDKTKQRMDKEKKFKNQQLNNEYKRAEKQRDV
jgi:hypothetical protein